MIIVNKPGEVIVSSHKIVARVEGNFLEIQNEHSVGRFYRGGSINPRVIVMSVQGERIVNLQFVPAADKIQSFYMPDYDTAEKFLTFIEKFIEGK